MSQVFVKSLDFVMKWEGGYVNDPADSGGATNYGISLAFSKGIGDEDGDGFQDADVEKDGDVDASDIRKLTKEQAAAWYEEKFWKAAKCDEMQYPLALALFDYAVHSGVRTAVKGLQYALGVKQDGVIGEETMSALRLGDDATVAEKLLTYRRAFLERVVERCERDEQGSGEKGKFLKGWLRRIEALEEETLSGWL